MIPKKIHYCWFGKKQKPQYVVRCISSWRKWFPDYEIKEWNESNFDVNLNTYSKEAYAAGKYAFVSDVARFWILNQEGGLYFDTDVEIVAPFDDIISKGAFMGIETPSENGVMPTVNPGLALGAEKGNLVIKAILDYYQSVNFLTAEGKKTEGTVVYHTTKVLTSSFGLLAQNTIQELGAITIYPVDFFNPFNDITGVLNKTSNTRSIHWFAKSWINKPPLYFRITRFMHRFLGTKVLSKIKDFMNV